MERTLDADLGWLAGIIDGEGSINASIVSCGYARADGTTSQSVRVAVCIGNTSESMIGRVMSIASRIGVECNLHLEGNKGRLGTRPLWMVTFSGAKRSVALLEAVLPHLTAKRAQAELGIAASRHRGKIAKKNGLRVDNDTWLKCQLATLSTMNKRGVEATTL